MRISAFRNPDNAALRRYSQSVVQRCGLGPVGTGGMRAFHRHIDIRDSLRHGGAVYVRVLRQARTVGGGHPVEVLRTRYAHTVAVAGRVRCGGV